MYYNPPYVLLVVGLLAAVASGVAFEAMLKQSVQDWSRHRSTRTLANLRGFALFLPFLGISLGVWVFLASGIQIFGFPSMIAYMLSFILTVFTAALVWYQLGVILNQLEAGGSKALDLDSF